MKSVILGEEVPMNETATVLQQLSDDHTMRLAEALLIALAQAKGLDDMPVVERISFESLPSVCRALAKELTRISWGQ